MFEKLQNLGFQIEMLHHAEAILTHDMPGAAAELEEVLAGAGWRRRRAAHPAFEARIK